MIYILFNIITLLFFYLSTLFLLYRNKKNKILYKIFSQLLHLVVWIWNIFWANIFSWCCFISFHQSYSIHTAKLFINSNVQMRKIICSQVYQVYILPYFYHIFYSKNKCKRDEPFFLFCFIFTCEQKYMNIWLFYKLRGRISCCKSFKWWPSKNSMDDLEKIKCDCICFKILLQQISWVAS